MIEESDVLLRKIGECPKIPEKVDHHPGSETRTYEIQVITPLFGGGTEAGVNDPVTLIRPSSIRGHLRFWWRATRGTNCANVADLRRREGEIWGTMENPSQIGLKVEVKSQGKTYPCAYFPEDKSFPRFEKIHPPYALFPFQGNKKEGISPSKCTSNVSFELRLTCPASISLDVEAAVWAWTNFGGIGARTRRGCGSLYCKEISPPEQEASKVKSWYDSCLNTYGIAPSTRHWPTLANSLLVLSKNNAMQAWTDVVGLMQTFRQGENVGRNPGKAPSRPGRSRWPEPETIRSATSRRDPAHSRMPAIPPNAFPKAEFGLPIVFHFKDYGDPKDTELYPVMNGEEKTRMSSPLILRPIICRNGAVLQMILRLRTQSPHEVILKKAPSNPKFRKIIDPTLAAYHNSPMGSPGAGRPARAPSGSAVDGFLAFAQDSGFVKVV